MECLCKFFSVSTAVKFFFPLSSVVLSHLAPPWASALHLKPTWQDLLANRSTWNLVSWQNKIDAFIARLSAEANLGYGACTLIVVLLWLNIRLKSLVLSFLGNEYFQIRIWCICELSGPNSLDACVNYLFEKRKKKVVKFSLKKKLLYRSRGSTAICRDCNLHRTPS